MIVFLGTLVAVVVTRLMQTCITFNPRPYSIMTDLGLRFPVIKGASEVAVPIVYKEVNSFPSDHAAYFSALALGLWSVNKYLGLTAIFWTLFIISLPRIYLGYHYPSDVIAGLSLGFLCMFLAIKVSFLRSCSSLVLAWGDKHQGVFYWLAFIITSDAAFLFDGARHIIQRVLLFVNIGALNQFFH